MGRSSRLGSGTPGVKGSAVVHALLAELGGNYASALGIALDGLRPEEVYKWFLAAVLYGAPIPERQATRTWHEFQRCGVLTPQRILDTGRDGLVRILDAGGYARYDFKTATKLLDINRALIADYGGDLNALHAAAADAADLERRITALGKGIGPVTAGIFLRELRGRWKKAQPPLSPLALAAASRLGLLAGAPTETSALATLKYRWRRCGMPADRFSEFEAALVRAGLRLRRNRAVRALPGESVTR